MEGPHHTKYNPPARLGGLIGHYRLLLGLPSFAMGLSGFTLGRLCFGLDLQWVGLVLGCMKSAFVGVNI